MKAIMQRSYGSPDLLRFEDVEMPTVADDQVLVRVRASSVNAGDWRRVRASPFIVRPLEGVRRPKNPRLGGDAAGVVEAVGKDVTHVKVGDSVFGARAGAFAEYVSGKSFVAMPASLTFEQAAAVPIAAITALQAIRDKGGIQPGQRVLVTGAGGGVGTFCVQIAKQMGGEVTAVTSTGNLELVRSIGADHVIDYTREDYTKSGRRFDLIIDIAGTPSLGAGRRALASGGKLVVVGAGRGIGGPIRRIAAAFVRSRLLRQRVVFFIAQVNKEDLVTIKDMIEAGKVTPVIDRSYPIAEIAEALKYLELGHARGKVVVTI